MTFIATALMGLFILHGATTAVTTNTVHTDIASSTPEVVADTEIPLSGPVFSATVTSYNAVPEQTDGSPLITASGTRSNPEVVAARSRDLAKKLPFGTVIAIEQHTSTKNCGYGIVESQVGYRVIADTMNASKHNQIDVLLNQTNTVRVGKRYVNPSVALGVCKGMSIRVVGYINMKRIPKTQAELARLMENNNNNALAIR